MRQITFVPGADTPSTGAASVRAEVLLRGAHLTLSGRRWTNRSTVVWLALFPLMPLFTPR